MLEDSGIRILPEQPMVRDHWPYTASSPQSRLESLNQALTETGSEVILCARGGYGASDLLPFLPWEQLKATPHKWIVGFSDITALQWALYSILGWPSVHGPMPASSLWGKGGERRDTDQLIRVLKDKHKQGSVKIRPLNFPAKEKGASGILLGGCLSVICSLSGTSYFPRFEDKHLIFLEDTGENPGRLMRHWNQLLQNGCLETASGVIIGRLIEHGSDLSEHAIRREMAGRTDIPCWESGDFGHVSPNFPLVNGSRSNIKKGGEALYWSFKEISENT